MMAPELHTPLESFLLFQTLHPFSDNNPPSFVKVSEVLKSNEQLRETEGIELERLEPDSLKNLYLRLLKEEAKAEAGHQEPQENPRKRKLSSPPIETVEEALQYSHLLPQLANRLYFRYREHAIEAIKEEERRYRLLQREIQGIERRDARGVSSIQTLLRHDDEEDKPRAGVTSRPTSSQDRRLRGSNSEPGAVLNGYPQETQAPNTVEAYGDQKHGQKPGQMENGAPFLPPIQHHGYSVGSPSSEINRRLPPPNQTQSHAAPLSSPRLNQNQLPRPERSSASPIVLPGPQGLLRSSTSGSPTGPLDALADMAGQQYRASPTVPPSRPVQHAGSQQHPHQRAAPQPYMSRPYPYYDNQPPYTVAYPQYGQSYSQHHGSMPPYQGHYQSPLPPYSQHTGYTQSPGYYQPSSVHTPYARGQVSRFTELHTPLSNASGRQRPPRPSPIFTSASSTKWKDTPGSVRQPSPVRPSVSPISEKAPSPSPDMSRSRPRSTRDQRPQPSSIESPGEGLGSRSIRATQSRATAKRRRGGRAGSVASSTVVESTRQRTRSHSVASQTDIDNQQSSTHKVEPEPSGTSVHEDDTSMASHTADEGSRKSTRQRPGTLNAVEETDSIRTSIKRKREELSILPPPSPSPAPSATSTSRPGYVLGTRNFPRISATIMEAVMAHKVANVFGRPLTEREAPGYRDLVFRPQDIKSIKAAINAGAKALAAAAENIEDAGTSSTVWVPETADVVPPKGIVNSAQLEKNYYACSQMQSCTTPTYPQTAASVPPCAHAYEQQNVSKKMAEKAVADDDLENDDSDEQETVEKGKEDVSVVKDAREMFEAVEPRISDWRNVERAAEETTKGRLRAGSGALEDVDEGGGEEEEEGTGEGEEVLGTVEREPEPEPEPEPRAKRRRR